MPKFIELTEQNSTTGSKNLMVNMDQVAYIIKQPTTSLLIFPTGDMTNGGMAIFVQESFEEIEVELNY